MIQSGTPMQLLGGYDTVNANDAGIVMNGLTTDQLQGQTGVYRSGNPWATVFSPNLIATNGAAASALAPASVAGVWGYRPYVCGPHWFNDDLSVNKSIPFNERVRLTLQAEFLNVTNHPTFSILNGGQNAPQNVNVQSLTFGQVTGGPNTARNIEFRANIVF